ncbi:MAG: hypothetical protein AAGG02_11460 [Cyanobacteria bacterium P01_H01_bin.15]
MSVLPSVVSAALGARVVGFSGSRSLVPSVLSVCVSALRGGSVFVGCARGVDSVVRSAFPAARVFRVLGRRSPSAFALRSVRFVAALASAGGVLFSFPGRPCPVGLAPSASSPACFCGSGSGSWASLAFALGSGVPCFVWLPGSVSPPASFGLRSVGGGWWVS